MVGWHHWLNGHKFSKLRELVMDREAWRAAVCGFAESNTTEQLNWTRSHLHCFQGLAIMNKAIVNTCVQVFMMDIHFQFLWLNTKKCDGWIIWQEYNSFYRKPQNCLPNWLCHFAFSPEMNESSYYSIPSLAFCIIKCSKFWPFK